jgi:hypothetical protein
VELTSTQKGAIAEAAITARAVTLGVVILRPLVEGRRYDLVFDTGPELLRVQCTSICVHARLGTTSRSGYTSPPNTRLGL